MTGQCNERYKVRGYFYRKCFNCGHKQKITGCNFYNSFVCSKCGKKRTWKPSREAI